MNFLIIHNRYNHVSGPETYLLNLKNKLELEGHSVDLFALDYEDNYVSQNSNFFPKPIGSRKKYSFKGQKLSIFSKLRIIFSLFYRHEVFLKLDEMLAKKKYDGALVLQFWGKLSPAIFDALLKNNIQPNLRISDFGLICGSNTLLKNNRHSEDCIENKFGCVRNKCVGNSYSRSLINSLAQIHFFNKYSKNINFIFTCQNTLSIFKRAGFGKNLFHLPTFYPNDFKIKESFKSKKIVFLGRVDEDKGIHKIIPLIPESDQITFEIWGSGQERYIQKLNNISAKRKKNNVKLMGAIDRKEISQVFKDSIFSIIPSLWHDNLPNALIESLSNGVPVIAPRFGCFPEFIKHNHNGFLYENFRDLEALLKSISDLSESNIKKMSHNSSSFAKNTFSSKIHIEKLLKIITSSYEKNT